ncbi:MAG: HDIG domain-containing protein [Clostridiales bacterium]|jgi:putative nucleotidyltransferase with HDIG domain|nr:HDIG domain-containing protein [Clostridiales bacterium]
MNDTGRKHGFQDVIKALLIFALMLGVNIGCMLVKFATGGVFSAGGEFRGRAIGSGIMTLSLITVSLFTYVVYSRKKILYRPRSLMAVCFSVSFGVVAGTAISAADIYYMPIAITAFLLVPLVDKRDVFFANTIAALSVTVILFFESVILGAARIQAVILMMFLGVFTGSVVAYSMSAIARRFTYTVRGFLIALLYTLALFLFSLLSDSFVFLDKMLFICISALGQVLVGVMLQPVLERMFNLLTNNRLIELADHNSPLIRRLISEAPGTFNHSLAVASFAEVCAINIGENPYLAKVCAYYHDIGKLSNPSYFAENQSKTNPHDDLLPEVSAQIIRKHTSAGYELCTRYRIPYEVKHVTVQHHGTLPIMVFYEKAKKLTDGEVNIAEYSYNGDTPVTKVAAILMVCDAAEAAIRSMAGPTAAQVEALLTAIINDRVERRQFDNCDITMRDLRIIRKTIIGIYGGLFHERVKYPSGKFTEHD